MEQSKRCHICGTKLIECKGGKLFCPNHGIIEEEETTESKDIPSYLG